MSKITKKKSIRLTSHIKPIKYTLTLKPDMEAFVFSGQEIIDITVEKETKKITLHSKDIDIETVSILKDKILQYANKISYDTKAETTTFYFKKLISKGKYKLSIVFSGIINETLRGFYKSKYVLDGKEKYLATTQFEATDARRAFPCFDEPAHKAVFKVSLIIPENHTAISNTLPINIEKHESGYKIVNFSPSPKMSTYLLAFIVGEFEYIEGYTKDKVQIRVFTTPNKKPQAKFALDVAIKSIEFYNDYFNIPYPLPTLDLIAIPDFESGAMENWGAVTFRETALLVDSEHSSIANKQWVALVIAHELAHQWFGNLVTMHWWTDLWLNEGFASYIEYLAVDHIFPNWKIWKQFLISDHNVALGLDGLNTSHPIEITVHHPDEINEIFDKISYSKGASIIRMLAEYLGEEKFRDGLRYYLKKHSYKNTETIHLWEAFEKVSKQPIKKMMDTWTKQTGYPLITINSDSKQKLGLRQERFFSSRISRKNNKVHNLWQIPVDVNDSKILLTQKWSPLKEKVLGKINKEENSFIRVRYDKESLNILREQVLDNKLTTSDRLGIIRDLFAIAESGYIPTIEALEFSLNYKNETEYIVWAEIASGINKINNIIRGQAFEENYKKYVLSLFSPLAEKMGFENKNDESHNDTLLRSLVLSQAGFYGDKKIIKEAKKIFDNRIVKPINADIRSAIYSIIAQNGKEKEWNLFKKLYLTEKMHEEKDRYGRALTQFKDEKILSKTLDFAISKDVRQQDAPLILGTVWNNSYGRDLAWKFMKNNWSIILKRYGEGGHFLSRLLSPLSNHVKTTDLKDAKKFFSKNVAPGADRSLQQAYEKVESNVAWLKDDKKDIEKWLKKNF